MVEVRMGSETPLSGASGVKNWYIGETAGGRYSIHNATD